MLNLGSAVAYLKLNTSDFDSSIGKAQSKFAGAGKAIGIAVGALVTSAVGGMIAFGKAAVDAGMTFDKSMSQVAATMGVTVDEIQDLKDYAMEMGAKTAFSASEAADALNYMALAGYDAETSMSMLPNVLNLAAAGGIELARASDMITDTQSALGLSLDETAELVDKMARASSKSNTSVEQLGDAMLTVGGTAKNLKGGTTELATMLGVLADNGIKGAEGGTALRNIILALSAPTDNAADKLEELGVQAYDADGNLRSLTDIFDDLNGAMSEMNQGEKTEVLNTIFNKVDLKSANALLATSSERFDELSESIDNASGAAQQMAETQLDNLAGDITLFKSALEGTKITLSNSLTPTLRNFVQFGTKEIVKLDNAFKTGGIQGFADQLGKSLGAAVDMIVEYAPNFISAIGTLISSSISSISKTLPKHFPDLFKALLSLAKQLVNSLASSIPDLMGGIGDLIAEVLSNIPNILEIGVKLIENIGKGIIQGIPKIAKGIWEGIKGLFSAPISEDIKIAQKELEELQEKVGEAIISADELNEALLGAEEDTTMAEYWLDVFDDLKDKQELSKGEQELLNKAVEELNKILPDTQQIVKDETGEWQANTSEIYSNIKALEARAKADVYYEKAREQLERIVDLEIERTNAEERLNELKGILVDSDDYYIRKIDDALKDTNTSANMLITTLWGYAHNPFVNDDWNALDDSFRALANMVGITEENFTSLRDVLYAIENPVEHVNTLIDIQEQKLGTLDDAIAAANDQVDSFYKSAEEQIYLSAKAIEESSDDIEDSVTDIKDTLDISGDAKRKGEDTGKEYTSSMASAIKAGKGDIVNQVNDIINNALGKVKLKTGSIFGAGSQGSYASGLDYVPRTMEVTVHRGERILTEEQNKKYSSSDRIEVRAYQDNTFGEKLNNTMVAVLDELKQLKKFRVELDGKKVVGALIRDIDHQLAYQN